MLQWQTGRRALAMAAAVGLGLSLSCGEDLDPASLVKTLRIIAVTADTSYPQPGQEVTLRMTYADLLDAAPRPVEVTWLTGCVDPPGGAYFNCYPEMLTALGSMGGSGSSGRWQVHREIVGPEWSGVPDAVPFTFTMPEDVWPKGQHPVTAFLFFAVCAGELRAAVPDGESRAAFPFECVDPAGNVLGADSFVPGFIELFAFADGRTNDNPPIDGITLGGAVRGAEVESAPTAQRCVPNDSAGCGSTTAAAVAHCTKYRVGALVPDIAEVVPGSVDSDGAPLRETVWVNFYASGGWFEKEYALVSDAAAGYVGSPDTKWAPPEEPGLVTIWVAAHDSRGGTTVKRAYVWVE